MIKNSTRSLAGLLAAAIAASACSALAATPVPPASVAPASVAATKIPEAVVDSFHRALKDGNREAALALLDEKVLILEGGGAERSKAEYAAHHLDADAEFIRAVPTEITRRTVEADGTMAWVATEGRTKGGFRGRDIDKVSAETMVLRRASDGWKIVHIHWSSADPR